jgi:hypothetical protein
MGAHEFRAEAGRHLVPLRLSSGASSYDLLGPDFTLFALNAGDREVSAFVEAASAQGIPLTIVTDAGGGEVAKYDARLVLVRPDQFVAWTGGSADDAGAILRRAAGFAV